MMEHIEFGYAHGYTEGMLRVLRAVESCSVDLKHHNRRFTQKEIASMISVMIADREKLRENPFAFVRCNQEKGWEVYEPKQCIGNPYR